MSQAGIGAQLLTNRVAILTGKRQIEQNQIGRDLASTGDRLASIGQAGDRAVFVEQGHLDRLAHRGAIFDQQHACWISSGGPRRDGRSGRLHHLCCSCGHTRCFGLRAGLCSLGFLSCAGFGFLSCASFGFLSCASFGFLSCASFGFLSCASFGFLSCASFGFLSCASFGLSARLRFGFLTSGASLRFDARLCFGFCLGTSFGFLSRALFGFGLRACLCFGFGACLGLGFGACLSFSLHSGFSFGLCPSFCLGFGLRAGSSFGRAFFLFASVEHHQQRDQNDQHPHAAPEHDDQRLLVETQNLGKQLMWHRQSLVSFVWQG
jgi:hypothetical protein